MKTERKKRWWWRILLLLVVVLGGVALYFVIYPKKLAKVILPDFNKVEELNAMIRNDSLYLNARGVFQSETFLPLSVDSLQYNFFVEDCVLYENKKMVDLHLAPGESDTVNINIHLPFDRLRHVSRYIHDMDSVTIGTDCQVVYKYFGRHITVKFTKKGRILRPVPPRITLAGLEKKKIKHWGKQIDTSAKLKVVNGSKKLNLQITDLEYTIRLGDKVRGHGRYPAPIDLKPQSTMTVSIPVSLNVDQPLKTAYELLVAKNKVHYNLDASAMVDFHSKKRPDKIKVYFTAIGDTDFSNN
jgi:LEA14-like dessication related protein